MSSPIVQGRASKIEPAADCGAEQREPARRVAQQPGAFGDRDDADPEEDDIEGAHEHARGLDVADRGEARDRGDAVAAQHVAEFVPVFSSR